MGKLLVQYVCQNCGEVNPYGNCCACPDPQPIEPITMVEKYLHRAAVALQANDVKAYEWNRQQMNAAIDMEIVVLGKMTRIAVNRDMRRLFGSSYYLPSPRYPRHA